MALSTENKIPILFLLLTFVAALALFRTCGKGCSSSPEDGIKTDTTIIKVDTTVAPKPQKVDVLDGNPQLDSLLDSIVRLETEKGRYMDEARHEKGRHYKYKNDAVTWREKYETLLQQLQDGDCDAIREGFVSQVFDLQSQLDGERFRADSIGSMFEVLKEKLSHSYVNEYRDDLGHGLAFTASITTDGFRLRPNMFRYSVTGELLNTETTVTKTEYLQKRNSFALLTGLQGDGNWLYAAQYSRNAKVFNLYLQPIYIGTDGRFGFQKGIQSDRFGLMAGIGFNLK